MAGAIAYVHEPLLQGHPVYLDDPGQFQRPLPPAGGVTSALKNYVMRGFPVRVDGPAQVALFAYDNNTFIVESFLPSETDVKISVAGNGAKLRNLVTGESSPPSRSHRASAGDRPRRSADNLQRASVAAFLRRVCRGKMTWRLSAESRTFQFPRSAALCRVAATADD